MTFDNAEKVYLVLDQYRTASEYNDFIGKYYHFPSKYLNMLSVPGSEFVYYEPKRKGKGEYFGYGRINGKPFEDKREPGFYFVEIADYCIFSTPVPFETDGISRETLPFYNPQNAVRRINKTTLEEICLDGDINLNFKADAHLIRVLGEQLIASEKVGILELVKNAYDAQASYCRIRIEKVDSLPKIDSRMYEFPDFDGPVIVIEDNGTGMTREEIRDGWMRPASTIKSDVKERLKKERENAIRNKKLGTYESLLKELKKEHGDRIPLGEKGVGRFATHRLAKHLIMKTKIQNLDYEYVLKINWDDFDKVDDIPTDLDTIGVLLTKQPLSRDYGATNSGTQLIIYGGREGFVWDKEKIHDLNQSILRLNSPSPRPGISLVPFRAFLECPQIPDLEQEDFLKVFDPIFAFDGLVDANGVLDYKLSFVPPHSIPMSPKTIEDKHFDLKKTEKELWKDYKKDTAFRKPECGPFWMHLDVWYRTRPWMEGPNVSKFSEYLDRFGGISIYRDGVCIFPAEWGAMTDWLDLSKPHIKKVSRMSYYNMIGNIEIDQMENFDLVDKTDREGLVDNKAYADLSLLVRAVIETIIMNEFQSQRDLYNALTKDIVRNPAELKEYTKKNTALLTNIINKYPVEDDPYGVLDEFGDVNQRVMGLTNLQRSIKNLEDSLDRIKEAQDMLTEQAGFGLAIAVSLHEVTKITANFYSSINELLKQKRFNSDLLEDLKASSASLNSELKRLGPLRAIRTEKRVKFPISKAINFVREVFRQKLQKIHAKIELSGNEDFYIFARYGALLQILSNLIDNSCYWLDTMDEENRTITINVNSVNRTVIIADNGPGIHDSILPYLFQAGYSLKIPASGLGLYICKYYMLDMKGDIYLTNSRERIESMQGAQFTLDFDKVPQDKEESK